MTDRLQTYSMPAMVGRIVVVLALVVGVLVTISAAVSLFQGMWEHSRVLLLMVAGTVLALLISAGVVSRRA